MKSPGNILIVDDDQDLLDLIGMRLSAAGYSVTLAISGQEALQHFKRERPRAVIADLRMEGMDGHELFARLHEEAPTVPVIMLTAHGTIPDAVAATQRGVFAFLTKPFDSSELLARVAEAVAISPTISTRDADGVWRTSIVSASLMMDEILRRARRIAEDDDSALIIGPRGVGKETLARAIHQASTRAKQAFITLTCGVLPPEDFEIKLFGTTKSRGVSKAGMLAAAAGGTLFIDEIENLPHNVQVRLLPLARKWDGPFGILRLGTRPAVRILAACESTPDRALHEGVLRADFYFSLAATTLVIPPLAKRPEDITALVTNCVENEEGNSHRFSPEALKLLQEASWPGNARQLVSVVKQAIQLSVTPVIPATLISQLLQEENTREMLCIDEARYSFERDYLIKVLQATNGNIVQAARIAERNRTEFYKLLGKYGIEPSVFKIQT